jgi:hypothetical protein
VTDVSSEIISENYEDTANRKHMDFNCFGNFAVYHYCRGLLRLPYMKLKRKTNIGEI